MKKNICKNRRCDLQVPFPERKAVKGESGRIKIIVNIII